MYSEWLVLWTTKSYSVINEIIDEGIVICIKIFIQQTCQGSTKSLAFYILHDIERSIMQINKQINKEYICN